jgi:uncharacterized membrane protein (GlpM family)
MIEELILLGIILLISFPIAWLIAIFVVGFGNTDKRIKKAWYSLRYSIVKHFYFFYCKRMFYYAKKADTYTSLEEVAK